VIKSELVHFLVYGINLDKNFSNKVCSSRLGGVVVLE
jgi:hypothetical protein